MEQNEEPVETTEEIVENNNTQAEQSAETQESKEAEQEFDPKQRVEFSTPEQQKKFNDLYKQVKMSDARNRMQQDMLQKAMDKLGEFEKRFSQTDHAEAERILNTRLKEARDSGDEEKADQILQEIIDFRVDSKLNGKKEEKPKVDPMADPDVRTVVQFAQETDDSGRPLRPWIDATHPQHANAMKLAGAVAMDVNAEYGYVDIGEVFRRMDEGMKRKAAPQGNSRAPDPMRGNLTNNNNKGKIKLSPQELAIANKLGVKPEEYLKWK